MAKVKLTKALLREHGVYNAWGFCVTGEGRIFIRYRPNGGSRSMIYSAWQVCGVCENTDPDAHFLANGHKTFSCYRETRITVLEEAKAWASEKYRIQEWVRDPFGDWQDRRVYDRIVQAFCGKGK